MSDPELVSFVKKSLNAGISRERIERALLDAGWHRDHVQGALDAFSDIDFPVAVPRPRARLSARDAFLYLVMFSMLYLSAYHLGSLLFDFIDRALPDPLLDSNRQWADRSMRFYVASLIVAFPVFLFTATCIKRTLALDPTQRSSAVRKWLTYLTLAIAACVLVGDLISVLTSLLSGELTLRFTLKALAVAAIAGSVFGYYLLSLRADDEALAR